jgi:hypothetical protein
MWTFIKVVGGTFASVFVFLAIAGYAASPQAKALDAAKQTVEAGLRDSGSAEFRNIKVFNHGTGRFVVCGEVNARNGFGGMTGYKRFFSMGGDPIIEGTDFGSDYGLAWTAATCDQTAYRSVAHQN